MNVDIHLFIRLLSSIHKWLHKQAFESEPYSMYNSNYYIRITKI